jgi:hypothetical protein
MRVEKMRNKIEERRMEILSCLWHPVRREEYHKCNHRIGKNDGGGRILFS